METALDEKQKTLGQLEAELEEANEALRKAANEAALARSAETAQLNRVNDIQKQIGQRIKSMQTSAPLRSDWQASPLNRIF